MTLSAHVLVRLCIFMQSGEKMEKHVYGVAKHLVPHLQCSWTDTTVVPVILFVSRIVRNAMLYFFTTI